ncbi:response regulator [Fulvivirgaceae bacterium PWU4]|uniref:Response regulator n=1 Tax=Chryseosolibacter histidini TaxID=2782349 RepID=A0AAP2DMI1_9BACT|nr:response regulator [Chryseosolibacter histidini]MBT1699050.1 response regulator [Chryseosolibacter histidini]
MDKVKILVVEDEPLVAKDLAQRLTGMGYEVASIAVTAKEALSTLSVLRIDLCLMDIRLEGPVDGIDLAMMIKDSYTIPVIFLTSHSGRHTFERAKEARPAAYLTKPCSDPDLQIAIDLAISNFASGKTATTAPALPEVKENDIFSLKESIFLRKKDRFERVDFKDILWAEAESNYSTIVTTHGSFVLALTLQTMEQYLNAPYFVRIHRSYLINIYHVESIEGNMLYIRNASFQVSKSKRTEVFSRFKMV